MRQTAMHRVSMFALGCAMLAGVAGTALALPPALPPVAPASKLVAAKMDFPGGKSHDFGEIFDHTKVGHKFEFVNAGDAIFEITNARSTCGCTVPAIVDAEGNEKKSFAPGEHGFINVEFNPKRRSGREIKPIYITLNNAPQPQFELSISSYVTQIVAQEPGVVYFRAVEKFGERPSLEFALTGRIKGFDAEMIQNDGAEMFTVEKVSVEELGVDASGDTLVEAKFRVTAKEGLASGRFTHNVIFKTTDERAPTVEVPISAQVLSDIQPNPANLMLGRMEARSAFEKDFVIASKTGRDFQIKDVLVNGPLSGSEWKVEPLEEGSTNSYRVTLTGTTSARARQSGQVTIVTTLEDEPTVSLNYSGWVPAPQPGGANPQRRGDANNLNNEDVSHLLVKIPGREQDIDEDEAMRVARENNKKIQDGKAEKQLSPSGKGLKKKGDK